MAASTSSASTAVRSRYTSGRRLTISRRGWPQEKTMLRNLFHAQYKKFQGDGLGLVVNCPALVGLHTHTPTLSPDPLPLPPTHSCGCCCSCRRFTSLQVRAQSRKGHDHEVRRQALHNVPRRVGGGRGPDRVFGLFAHAGRRDSHGGDA